MPPQYLVNGRAGRAATASFGRRRERRLMLTRTMDAQQALADLTEISSQIQAAVVFDDQGKVAASTLGDSPRADELARAAGGLLAAADGIWCRSSLPTEARTSPR
jgi:FixJ family two-component response regulator